MEMETLDKKGKSSIVENKKDDAIGSQATSSVVKQRISTSSDSDLFTRRLRLSDVLDMRKGDVVR